MWALSNWSYSCLQWFKNQTAVNRYKLILLLRNNRTFCQRFPAVLYFLMFFAMATPFQMKSFLMGKDSVSCHVVTALVYSPASISDPEGLAVTCWHHFIHLVENERRVPCSFTILSHLARFLSLLVCLTPRAWKIENMLSLPLSLDVCVLQLQTPTHKKCFVCTLKYLCVGVCNPWVLALCLKKHAKLLYLSSPSLSATLFTSSWYSSLLDRVVRYVRSESADQRRRQASGWVLAVFRVRDKPWLYDEWPVKRRWQLETHTTYNNRLQRQTNILKKPHVLMYHHDCSGVKSRNIPGSVVDSCIW